MCESGLYVRDFCSVGRANCEEEIRMCELTGGDDKVSLMLLRHGL